MKASTKIFLLLAGIIGLILAAPFLGGEHLVFSELAQPSSPSYRILFELRVPRLLLAITVGGALAVLGGTYQILFHNPLAEPYILGVSSAVTLGVAASEILFHLPAYSYWGSLAGGAGAIAITVAMIALFRSGRSETLSRLILFGMGVNFVLSSTLFLLVSYTSQTSGGGSFRWLFGQIPWVTLDEALVFAALSAPFLAALFLWGRSLDALALGDGVARTLGYSPPKARNRILAVSSILIALVVSFTGAIGFVGLVVPHAVRLVFRPATTRALFAVSFVVGAGFLVISDVLARSLVPPLEFPIGIITTLVGGPIFLYLLWRRW